MNQHLDTLSSMYTDKIYIAIVARRLAYEIYVDMQNKI